MSRAGAEPEPWGLYSPGFAFVGRVCITLAAGTAAVAWRGYSGFLGSLDGPGPAANLPSHSRLPLDFRVCEPDLQF